MRIILKILTSIALGLSVYLFMLCEPRGVDRHLLDLFVHPDKFFQSFDVMMDFEVIIFGTFGVAMGLSFLLFWIDTGD